MSPLAKINKGKSMEYKTFSKKQTNRVPPEKYEELVKKARKESEKLVKGRFDFVDAQGGFLEFAYRFFKDDPLVVYKLFHGEVTELPQGIVKHLNNTKKKIRKFGNELKAGTRGVPSTYEVQSRVAFIPVDAL
jgi:regulatory protein YycH of two-component signal transduction system YycFG